MYKVIIKNLRIYYFKLKRKYRYLLIKMLLNDSEKHILYLALDTRIDFLDKIKITDKCVDYNNTRKDIKYLCVLQYYLTKMI